MSHKHTFILLFTAAICVGCLSCAAQPERRYFIIHRDLPATASAIEDNFLTEIADSAARPHNDTLALGVSVVFNILGEDLQTLDEKLRRILQLSQEDDIPIYINIDGQNWTNYRSDLWNWWDETSAGYDPQNRNNVEWTGWSPDSAVKVCWRDWGRQLRVTPALNIFAPRVVEAHREGFRRLLPIIKSWRDALPADKKYLFAGLHIGWEAGFNYNAYYYKGGNELYDRYPDSEDHDPRRRTSIDTFDPAANTEILGHAAAVTLGIKDSGQLTNADFEQMTHRYLEMWCREASEYGFSRDEIYTHMGGNYSPFDRHLHFWPAMNEYSTAGWSFYAMDPHNAGTLDSEMAAAGRTRWAATEWLWTGDTAEQTLRNILTTYSFRDCRMIVYYNWSGLTQNAAAREAIKNLFNQKEQHDKQQ